VPLTFVDTNVLAYAHDRSDSRRQAIAEAILQELWDTRTGIISTQVLQEFYVVVTRKFDPPISRSGAREIVDAYAAWHVVPVDPTLIITASRLEERHQLSFWDALIVEAARRGGASRLLTDDLRTGSRLGGVAVENPFAE
jgi:predicted nucleic acid-binding protein